MLIVRPGVMKCEAADVTPGLGRATALLFRLLMHGASGQHVRTGLGRVVPWKHARWKRRNALKLQLIFRVLLALIVICTAAAAYYGFKGGEEEEEERILYKTSISILKQSIRLSGLAF